MTRASVRTRSRAIADDTSPAFRSARRLPPIPLAIVLTVLTVVSVVSSVAFGAEHIPVGDVWRTVWAAVVGGEAERAHSIIILDLRLPRSVLAALVGAGLALAGAAMQTLVRNPLAEPYLLGVSAGAAVGATAVITLGFLGGLGVWALSGGALLGALGATVLVYAVASATGGLTALRLILAG
ncbi:iron chelate uptake ABC transporter family permease subunit, partial [Dietzia sp. HMSC21D01]|uniref:iron chelate uptake ABC transporter family permease subunit n=1 Tax=Dietzia sp. HMSC21D01 TaxID=1581054 RepID=UPI000AFCB51F